MEAGFTCADGATAIPKGWQSFSPALTHGGYAG